MMVQSKFDLIIVGATPAGIAAAIAAARLGRTSLILERTAYIGGLPANGLGATDIATRGATGGIFLEFVERVKAHYVKSYGPVTDQVSDCDDGYHFEPSVAENVFNELIQENPEITVLTRRQFDFEPDHLSIRDGIIKSIEVTNLQTGLKETHYGQFFLDATYEGDLIAAAGVPFFVGREGKEVYGELGAGRVYKLWRGPECDGTTNAGDNAIQAFNYRLCLTNDPKLRVRVSKPSNYNRKEFSSLVLDVTTGIHTGVDVLKLSPEQMQENIRRSKMNLKPVPNHLNAIQRLSSMVKLPNNKTDANNQHFAFISTDLPEENWPYPTSSWAWRDAFCQRMREYTEGLFYFAQNDPELPQWFRDECNEWGWAKDEYVDNDHFPRQLYVREGRRMKGKHIFTVYDALPSENGRPPIHHDSVTASHYALDSHAVRKREPGRVHLDGFISYPCAPYTVPYGVMVPDAPIKNLLAPVPVSASHIGFSTLRMEPCWMALGQAAGVAAAFCLQDGVAAADVDVAKVQDELLNQEAVLFHDPKIWGRDSKETFKSIQLAALRV
ncbi:Uncharacterized protein BP5553_02453 [Venustampulla echinocandica]|uniref:FAD protein n=1 Tax=Venustampulla echinocandica TaxID=2656787 RepID=A0A370U3X6_9HELO|nr:Uncharacterized protein BP5553_02453 [Venustampulla echinocandica]RDL42474.1 Uncharacterized protein BP5553_02453 [Venustampulla echinocandica]